MIFIPLLVVFFGLILRHMALWCVYEIPYCFATNFFHSIFLGFINPFYTFSIFFLPPALLLLVVGKQAFNSWLRLAMWWLPLSVIVIAITPTSSNAWMPLYFVGKDTTTLIMAGLFTALSLLLILWKQFSHSKKQGTL
jgi:hypothetical protein